MQTKTNAIALTFILGFGGLIAILYAALDPLNSQPVYAHTPSSSATNTELVYPVYLTATLLIEELPDGTQIELVPSPNYNVFDSAYVLKQDGLFKMWLNNRNDTSSPTRIAVEQYLESQDGVVWANRINTNLIDNTPDYHHLGGIREVVYDQGVYEGWESTYYNVVNGMWVRTIRYITSTNGLHWQIVTPSIIASAGAFNLAKSAGLYEMWAYPSGDSSYTGTRSLRYRTSAMPDSDWGHWQTGGTLVLIDGAEVLSMTYLRKLPDGAYQLFYVTGSYVHSAISNDGINFTTTTTNLFNFEEILPDYGVLRTFMVVDVNGEDWFYFNYRDTSGQGKLAVVRPEWPVSELSADNDSPTPLGGITHLTATLSTGSNVTYTWDLGDGAAATGATVAHTYPAIGVYTAVVTASNSSSTLSTTTVVTITDAPIVALTAVNDSPTTLGQTTHLTATITDGTGVTYAWDLGDGAAATGATVTHTYPAMGVYTAVVTASNSSSTFSTTTVVTITDAPIVALTAVNDSPTTLGQTTHLTATITDGTGVTYAWDLGDGAATTGAAVTHTYPAVGVYTAVVTASNSSSVLSATTTVTVTDAPIVSLTAVNDSPTTLGQTTHLTATITDGTGVTYAWDLGDGAMTTGASVAHTYPAIGVYTAVVTASNSSSVLSATTTVTVTDAPIAGLTAVNDSPTTLGQTTHLTATITDGTGVTYAWDLGDGAMATGTTVAHTYPATGTYTALVTAVNSAGSMTATTTIVITPQAVPSSRLLYLPLITTAPPFTPIFIGAAIQARPVLVRGEQFFETTITIPNTLPATGHFYLSTSPSALTPVIVDDKFLLTSGDTVYFAYLFSDGTPPQFATVEIPQTTLRALQGHTVTIAYQDVYGTLVRASEMWLIWIAAHND